MSRRARCAECSCSHDPQISRTHSPFTLGPTGSSESLRSVVASAEVLAREALAAGDPSCPCWLPHAPRAAHWICTSEGIARVLACGFSSAERLSANGFFKVCILAHPSCPTAAPSPSRRRQRPVLASSPLLFFFLDGPARAKRALDVHAPPPDVDVPWGSTETDARVPALGCLCPSVSLAWPSTADGPGRSPPCAGCRMRIRQRWAPSPSPARARRGQPGGGIYEVSCASPSRGASLWKPPDLR